MPVIKRQEETLTPRQIKALECLVSQGPDESYKSVAQRAGISRAQLYRYMSDKNFLALYNQRIRDEFRLVRMKVSRALFRNAMNGDVQSQRLYFQLSGLLAETIEFTTNPQNIETIPTVNVDNLTPEARQALWAAIQQVTGISGFNDDNSDSDLNDNSGNSPGSISGSRFFLADPTQKASFSGAIEDRSEDNNPDSSLDGIDSALLNSGSGFGSGSGSGSGSNYRPNLDLFDETPGEVSAVTTAGVETAQIETAQDDYEEF